MSRKSISRRRITADYVDSLRKYAELLYRGGITPKGCGKPEALAALIEIGRDVGLPATQAIANVKVVNGRPSIYGDAALALVRASGLLVEFREWDSGSGDDYGWTCLAHRVGAKEPRICTFTVADAKRARLWGKEGPWTDYPARMLMFRARGFALRDEFTDVLCGLALTEEVEDAFTVRQPSPAAIPDTSAAAAILPHLSIPPIALELAPVAVDSPATGEIRPEQIDELIRLRGLMWAAMGLTTDEEQDAAWARTLADYGVESALNLSAAQAEELITTLGGLHDPFSYPPKPSISP